MSQIAFQYSKKAVSRAGVALLGEDSGGHPEHKKVLDNWRACHIAPLSRFSNLT